MDMKPCSGSEGMAQIEGELVGPVLVVQTEELHYHVFLVVHTNVDHRNCSLEASHKLSLKNILLLCFTVYIQKLR